MNKPYTEYISPFSNRYSSREMSYIWSDHNKFCGWRRLWYLLAKYQKSLGADISDEQISDMEINIDTIDMNEILKHESTTKHDVVSHMMHFCDVVPSVKDIIHQGATSQYLVDNQDVISIRDSCIVVLSKLASIIGMLGDFAWQYKDMPVSGLTHFQDAQPVTVGKRALGWTQDFVIAIESIGFNLDHNLKIRGIRGTTGTHDALMKMFNGDMSKVEELNNLIAVELGFGGKIHPVVNQTYTRLSDAAIMSGICLIASAASKMCTDIRLLSGRGEIREGFGPNQVGSSAMPYKRNPINSEKVCSLARYSTSLLSNFYDTASVQWCERSLDDSANRRISIPEVFLTIDEILDTCIKIIPNLYVDKAEIERRMNENDFKYLSESVIIKATGMGMDREEVHKMLNEAYSECDGSIEKLDEELELPFSINECERGGVGNSEDQVEMYIATVVEPIRKHFGVDQ